MSTGPSRRTVRRRVARTLPSCPRLPLLVLALLPALAVAGTPPDVPFVVTQGPAPRALTGTAVAWHTVTLDFAGPPVGELVTPNPFLHRRFDAAFTHLATGTTLVVPGFFAADGDAAESGATNGDTWRVRFTPPLDGTWAWTTSYLVGADVAVTDPPVGTPVGFHGAQGTFVVAPADEDAPGFHGTGAVVWTGEHLLRHAESGAPFLEGGANSPENLLAYKDFDQTPPSHAYAPHAPDWKTGDPSWKGGRGKGLVGALNYLASQEMNSVYFLTYNVGGDGDDVWPFVARDMRLRYDVSKLAQWDVVFSHMDRLGLLLHVVLQEQENDNGMHGLDGGQLGTERRLYHRELVARFGHHLGLLWNLGEENTNTGSQREAFYAHLMALDAYDHPVLVHTFPEQKDMVYGPLLDDGLLEAASLQDFVVADVHASTLAWRLESKLAARPWAIFSHEFGPSNDGVVPDSVDFWHDDVRIDGLWGNLMAGGAGVEWYFGKAWPDNDLTCEDWRSRAHMWELTRFALRFFREHVPVDRAMPDDTLVSEPGAHCLAERGETYVVQLPAGGSTLLWLDPGDYVVRWFDPRFGGPLQAGDVVAVDGPAWRSIGAPPYAPTRDWVVLVTRDDQVVVGEVDDEPANP